MERKGKSFTTPITLIRNGRIKPHIFNSRAHNFTDGLTKGFYSGLIYYHGIAVIKIAQPENHGRQ